MFNNIICRLRKSEKLRKVLYKIIIFLSIAYLFFIPSFSGRTGFNLVGFPLFGLLLVVVLAYTFLFSFFQLKYKHIALFIFSIIALVGTIFWSHSFRSWLTILLMAITFFIFTLIIDIIKRKQDFVIIGLVAMLLFSLYFVFIYRNDLLNFSNYSNMRLGDYFDNVNQIGSYFLLASILSLYCLLFLNTKYRFFNAIIFPYFVFLGFTTGSRTFLISLLVGVIFLLFFKFKDKKVLLLVVVAVFASFIVLILSMPFAATIRERMFDMLNTLFGSNTNTVEGSTVQRTVWQGYAFYLGLHNIFFGFGADGFIVFSGTGTYSHANFVEIFCNFGLIGFLTYYFIWFVSIKESLHNKNKLKYLALCILIVFIAKGILEITYYNKIVAFELALSLSFSYSEFNENYYEVKI